MLKKLLKIAVSGVLVLCFAAQAAVTPSPAMMAQFKNLPKSEQQRLMRQMGISASDLSGQRQNASTTSSQDGSGFDPAQLNAQQEVAPYQPAVTNKAERFGLSLFKTKNYLEQGSTNNVPVPDSYLLGAGDELLVQVFGKQSFTEVLVVERDGTVSIPELGQLVVAGLTFPKARQLVTERIKSQLIGVDVAVSMGELRTITVFVAGEAGKPGSYNIPALSSVTQALTAAGGVSDIGSLRKILVKRGATTVTEFDLYNLLLKGDASADVLLQHGDVVFVAPVQAIAEVTGEVQRPALYEVKSGETIAQLLAMSGGAKAGAYTQSAVLERINSENLRTLQNLDLTKENTKQEPVRSGDVLRIGSTSPRFENVVTVAGAVARPGQYAWRDGLRVTDLLGSFWSDLHLTADLDYALIVRETSPLGDLKVIQFNLGNAVNQKGSAQDPELQARDTLLVFHYENNSYQRAELNAYFKAKAERANIIRDDLAQPSAKEATSAGYGNRTEVTEQDALENESLMEQGFELLNEQNKQRLNSLQQPPAQLSKNHQWLLAEINTFFAEVLTDPELLKKTPHLNRTELLYPVLQKLKARNSYSSGSRIVSVAGEVKVPGEYPLAEQATVKDLLAAASGLKESAYLDRAELTQAYTDASTGDLQVKHQNVNLLQELQASQGVGLNPRDRLTVFAIPNWNIERQVMLSGFVRFPGMYTIQQGEKLSSVLARAGGLKSEAFAEGAVFTRKQSRDRESEQVQKLAQQLRTDIAARSLTPEGTGVAPQEALMMINEIEKVKPVGRVVIDLNGILSADAEFDLTAEDGDELYVPSRNSSVAVVGEVQHASSHRFKPGQSIQDYLSLAGGFRKRADEERVYVIRADGSVFIPDQSGWFAVQKTELKAGDTIVVPLDTEYKDTMSLWTQITQIFYQSAVALAAVNSF
ncbi:SLBB domain-containing protein [Rheinheimera sp.]|uniref:SLBB domain-containing protein n=1 Tax=Rheinheimera sp. TaxID=1869214 RepID=UPI00307DE151